MTVRIRLAEPAEAALVHELMIAAFETERHYPNPSSALRESVADVEAAMARGGAIVLEVDGRGVGSGRFALEGVPLCESEELRRVAAGASLARRGGALSFSRLAVLGEERGVGHGARMIAWLEGLAGRLGCEQVRCDARSQQPDNRPYYLRLGYEVTGYAARYGIPDIRTHMCKPIRPV